MQLSLMAWCSFLEDHVELLLYLIKSCTWKRTFLRKGIESFFFCLKVNFSNVSFLPCRNENMDMPVISFRWLLLRGPYFGGQVVHTTVKSTWNELHLLLYISTWYIILRRVHRRKRNIKRNNYTRDAVLLAVHKSKKEKKNNKIMNYMWGSLEFGASSA